MIKQTLSFLVASGLLLSGFSPAQAQWNANRRIPTQYTRNVARPTYNTSTATNAYAKTRMTPRQAIYYHASKGNTQNLYKLKQMGYQIDLADAKGNSALCEAVWRQDRTAVSALISVGANQGSGCMQQIPANYKTAMGINSASGYSSYYGTKTATATATSSGLSTGAMVGIGVGAAALIGGGIALAAGGGGGGGSSSSPAPCSGHGTKDAEGICQCSAGYAGENCESCASTHINQGGICYAKLNCVNGSQVKDSCECPNGWHGTLCDVADSCEGYKESCGEGYASTTTCNHGGDVWYSCDKCDSNHIMFDNVCYDKITCAHGGSQTGPTECSCTGLWTGDTCNTCSGFAYEDDCYTPLSCGTNKHQEADGCVCDAGYPHEYNGQCYALISGGCGTNKHQQGNECVCDDGYKPSGNTCVLNRSNVVGTGYIYSYGTDTGYEVYNNNEDINFTSTSNDKHQPLEVWNNGTLINNATITYINSDSNENHDWKDAIFVDRGSVINEGILNISDTVALRDLSGIRAQYSSTITNNRDINLTTNNSNIFSAKEYAGIIMMNGGDIINNGAITVSGVGTGINGATGAQAQLNITNNLNASITSEDGYSVFFEPYKYTATLKNYGQITGKLYTDYLSTRNVTQNGTNYTITFDDGNLNIYNYETGVITGGIYAHDESGNVNIENYGQFIKGDRDSQLDIVVPYITLKNEGNIESDIVLDITSADTITPSTYINYVRDTPSLNFENTSTGIITGNSTFNFSDTLTFSNLGTMGKTTFNYNGKDSVNLQNENVIGETYVNNNGIGSLVFTNNGIVNGSIYGVNAHIINNGEIIGGGIHANGGTVYNVGDITINSETKTGLNAGYCSNHECFSTLGSLVTKDTLYGMDGYFYKIPEKYEMLSGAYKTGYYKTRTGSGTQEDPYLLSDYYAMSKSYITLENGASLITSGSLQTMSTPLNLDMLSQDGTGKVVAEEGTELISDVAVVGTVSMSNNFITDNFKDTVVAKDMIQTPDASGLKLISESALFDAKLADNGSDVVMKMKNFDDVVPNKSLAQFLTNNYALANNANFYNKLKSFDNLSSLNNSLNQLTGKDVLSRFNFEDMSMMRELNYDMNNNLFHSKENHLSMAGSISPMAFKGDTGSNSRYSLFSQKHDNTSIGLGIAFTDTRSDDDHESNNRHETMYQMIVPFGYKAGGFNMITSPRIGYARGEYDRTGFDGMNYDGTLEKRVYGVMNEARYPFKVAGWSFEPSLEFNVLGYQQKGSEDGRQFSLNVPNQQTLSVEGGMGFYATKETELSHGKVNLSAGLALYHEFADPYKLKLGMEGMDGSFEVRDENRSDNRAVARAGFNYTNDDNLEIYGSILSYIDKEARTKANTGMKWRF